MHGQRGQTIPVWIFGTITTLMLTFMIFNYANTVRWSIRAQNASDAVAQGVMSVQTQHYNEMMVTIHAAAIEEYRIRRTMNALLETLQGSGGCTTPTTGTGTPFDCATVYASLRANYIAQVTRYGQLVQQMQSISNYTQAQQIADMNTIAQSFETTCTTTGPTGGDCAFSFSVTAPTARPNTSGALIDAAGEDNGNGRTLPANIAQDLQPLQIEVIACAKVNSPFGSLLKLNIQPYYAIGRAAATSAMVTQEWFAPGSQTNPNSPGGATTFQPSEFVESPTNTSNGNIGYSLTGFCDSGNQQYDWYAVHWCSNAYTSIFNTPAPGSGAPPVYGGYETNVNSDEYSVWTGWWGVLPLAPYSGTFTPSAANCAQNVPWNTP
jgi:hypothetical protein